MTPTRVLIADDSHLFGDAVELILEAVLAIGSLYAIKLLIDAVTPALQGQVASEPIVWGFALVTLTLIASAGAGAAARYLRM